MVNSVFGTKMKSNSNFRNIVFKMPGGDGAHSGALFWRLELTKIAAAKDMHAACRVPTQIPYCACPKTFFLLWMKATVHSHTTECLYCERRRCRNFRCAIRHGKSWEMRASARAWSHKAWMDCDRCRQRRHFFGKKWSVSGGSRLWTVWIFKSCETTKIYIFFCENVWKGKSAIE